MNDFTKQELQRIIEGVTWWLDGDEHLPSLALIDKIQLLIDNYCDHIWTDGSGNHIFCTKCNNNGGKR